VIDPIARRLVATIRLPGTPEYAAAGADGLLFDNITDRNEVAVVDVAARRVLRTYPLRRCQGPTGLAYDAPMICCWRCAATVWRYFVRGRDGSKWQISMWGRAPTQRCSTWPATWRSSLRRPRFPDGARGSRRGGQQGFRHSRPARQPYRDSRAATGLVYVLRRNSGATDPHERPSAVPGTSEFWSSSRSGDCLPACDDSTKGDVPWHKHACSTPRIPAPSVRRIRPRRSQTPNLKRARDWYLTLLQGRSAMRMTWCAFVFHLLTMSHHRVGLLAMPGGCSAANPTDSSTCLTYRKLGTLWRTTDG